MNVETKIRVERHTGAAGTLSYTSVWLDHYVDGNKEVVNPTLLLRVPTFSVVNMDPTKNTFAEYIESVKESAWYRASK